MEWTVAIGVDTHKEVHVAVAFDALGAQLDSREIATTPGGLPAAALLGAGARRARLRDRGHGQLRRGARSLPRASRRRGLRVRASAPPGAPAREERSDRRRSGRAAVARGERLSLPRGGGRREDLRLLLLERRGAMQARTAALNQLSAVLVTAPEHVRERLGALSGERLARAAARLRPHPDVVNGVLRRLGRRVERLSKEVAEAERTLAALRRRGRARSARGVRRGAGLRRPAPRLERRPQPDEKRGILRRARRHQPGRGLERQAATAPAQPRRRPPAQLGAPRRRPATDPPPPRDHRLLRAATRSGQDRQGSTPLRQARARPPLLPTPARDAEARP